MTASFPVQSDGVQQLYFPDQWQDLPQQEKIRNQMEIIYIDLY